MEGKKLLLDFEGAGSRPKRLPRGFPEVSRGPLHRGPLHHGTQTETPDSPAWTRCARWRTEVAAASSTS